MIKTIREMSIAEWSKFIQQEVSLMIDRKSKNCLNCMHFDDDTQLCNLVGQMPPPKIAVHGCEKWDEEIPF